MLIYSVFTGSQGGVCSCGEQEYTKLVPEEPTERVAERERRNSISTPGGVDEIEG